MPRPSKSPLQVAAFDQLRPDLVDSQPKDVWSVASAVAQAFSLTGVELRARVLSRLLSSVGPLALLVLGDGAFAKFAQQARWSGLSVSFEDAGRATTGQVFELASYVQQSNPEVANEVLALLSQDVSTMTARDRAALAIGYLSARNAKSGIHFSTTNKE